MALSPRREKSKTEGSRMSSAGTNPGHQRSGIRPDNSNRSKPGAPRNDALPLGGGSGCPHEWGLQHRRPWQASGRTRTGWCSWAPQARKRPAFISAGCPRHGPRRARNRVPPGDVRESSTAWSRSTGSAQCSRNWRSSRRARRVPTSTGEQGNSSTTGGNASTCSSRCPWTIVDQQTTSEIASQHDSRMQG